MTELPRYLQNNTMNGEIGTGNNVPWPMGDALRKSFGSDFKYVTMATYNIGHILTHGDKKLTNNGTYFEPSALEMLSIEMLKGNNNALNDPSSILLSESTAKVLFWRCRPDG